MSIRIPYTHGYDRGLIVLRSIAYFIWLGIVLSALSVIGELLGALGINFSWLDGRLNGIFMIILFIGLLMLTVYLHNITTNRWIGILSAWLYIRNTLKTQVSFADAAKVSWLFVPNETGKWYPMKEVLQVPQERRREYIFATAVEIARRLCEEQQTGGQRFAQRRG